MKHQSLNVKKFTIKDNGTYRVRVESWECLRPQGHYNIDMIQESIDDKGEVEFSSTYNFHMTKDEIATLCKGLMA